MRKIIFFIMLLNIFAVTTTALDTKRDVMHIIDENISVYSHYTDYFYGEVADDVKGVLDFYENDYDYIISRLPYGFVLREWTVNSSEGLLEINIWGDNDNYVIKKNDMYKISGKGFIDRLCSDFSVEIVQSIEQEFHSVTILPESLNIVSIPQSSWGDYNYIYYEYDAWQQANELHEGVLLFIKQDVDIFDYCVEREEIDLVLKQGFIATTGMVIPHHVLWLMGVLFIVIVIALIVAITKK